MCLSRHSRVYTTPRGRPLPTLHSVQVATAVDTALPLTIGLEARWGGGKSFLLSLVQHGVEKHARGSSTTLKAMHTLWRNTHFPSAQTRLTVKTVQQESAQQEPPPGDQASDVRVTCDVAVVLAAHTGNNLRCQDNAGNVRCVNRNRRALDRQVRLKHLGGGAYVITSLRNQHNLQCRPDGSVRFANRNEDKGEQWAVKEDTLEGKSCFTFVSMYTGKVLQCRPDGALACVYRWEAEEAEEDNKWMKFRVLLVDSDGASDASSPPSLEWRFKEFCTDTTSSVKSLTREDVARLVEYIEKQVDDAVTVAESKKSSKKKTKDQQKEKKNIEVAARGKREREQREQREQSEQGKERDKREKHERKKHERDEERKREEQAEQDKKREQQLSQVSTTRRCATQDGIGGASASSCRGSCRAQLASHKRQCHVAGDGRWQVFPCSWNK